MYFQAERERQLDYHYMEDQRREWELKVSIFTLRNYYVIDRFSSSTSTILKFLG